MELWDAYDAHLNNIDVKLWFVERRFQKGFIIWLVRLSLDTKMGCIC